MRELLIDAQARNKKNPHIVVCYMGILYLQKPCGLDYLLRVYQSFFSSSKDSQLVCSIR